MNTHPTEEAIARQIEQHVAGQPAGALESHDLNSLSRRILAPVDVVLKLLAAGVLQSEGPVHQGDDTGRHTFQSDLLNEVRTAVLTAIVERTVEESDGVPDEISIAAGHALRAHVDGFTSKGNEKTEFARFPERLVQLSVFRPGLAPTDDTDGPSAIESIARTGAKVAAVGGLGYGAAALLRGRGIAPNAGLLGQLRAGSAANLATGRALAQRLGVGAQKVAAVLAGRKLV